MLELFTRHGAFDLELKCDGDLDVDQHHTVEDVGIALGEAFDRALGDKRGILRAGYFLMPMDETLAIAAIDLSGRAAFAVETKVRVRLVGDLQTELVTDFFEGFARGARANVHVKTMYGRSNHHKIEAIFKAFARALRVACSKRQTIGRDAAFHQRIIVMRVTVIDYKAGNLTSVLKALRHLGAETIVTDGDLALVETAERIVLPGVGHFQRPRSGSTRRASRPRFARRLRAAFPSSEFVLECSGSMLARAKRPNQPGLAHFKESCAHFVESPEKVPHVGWNSLEVRKNSELLAGVEPGEYVYFTHSYKAPVTADTAAVTYYIEPFASAVERGNVMGVQFHPEKSGATGLKILGNFLSGRKLNDYQAHHRLPRRA
jgi:imidazoleglycerol-phosphate dehydratase